MMAQRMVDTFGKKVPIIPSLGNNDVYPHNIMEPGPNRVTQEFLKYVHATHSYCSHADDIEFGSTSFRRSTVMCSSVAATLPSRSSPTS